MENILKMASKIAEKEFTVKEFDIYNILTQTRILDITLINQMLMVIPNDKFEIHIKQIKE